MRSASEKRSERRTIASVLYVRPAIRASLESRTGESPARPSALQLVMPRIRMYTTRWCGYCVRAKALLDSKGLEDDEVYMDDDPAFRSKLRDLTGGWTVPQILIDDEPIGGYTELWRLDRDGRLDELLAAETPSAAPLAVRAVPRAPTGGADLLDRRPAPVTRLSGSAVDLELFLHGAARAVWQRVVPERRALARDSGLERTPDPAVESPQLVRRQVSCSLER